MACNRNDVNYTLSPKPSYNDEFGKRDKSRERGT